MYECTNCGGELRFDIATQQLRCDHCDSAFDPYEYEKNHDAGAEESTEYGVTVFKCPSCGGEILSTNVTAAGFCSYCGASTVLESRVSREKRPAYIIPFKKTKKDCTDAYRSLVRRAVFAPSEMRKAEHMEKFRGIYMPYWVYDVDFADRIDLEGHTSHRSGDYVITKNYSMSGRLDAFYGGFTYDASSAFDDRTSMSIAPFNASQIRDFTPSMLCGFYADTADVPEQTYVNRARQLASDDVSTQLRSTPAFRPYNPVYPNSFGLGASVREPKQGLLPVWFLTWRNRDRVAYAVMNGETGAISADLPVSPKKYLLGSLLLAIPIFLLVRFLFSATAPSMLFFAALLSLVTAILYRFEVRALCDRELRVGDTGYEVTHRNREGAAQTGQAAQSAGNAFRQQKKTPQKDKKAGGRLIYRLFGAVIVFLWIVPTLMEFMTSFTRSTHNFIPAGTVIALLILMFLTWTLTSDAKKVPEHHIMREAFGALGASALACVVSLWQPYQDWIYYLASIAALLGIVFTILGIIRKYNILATRPVPELFDRKGGDDRA